MRKVIPIVAGAVLLLVGAGWGSQGAGLIGGSSLMDNNPTSVLIGGLLAVIIAALVVFGAASRPKPNPTAVG